MRTLEEGQSMRTLKEKTIHKSNTIKPIRSSVPVFICLILPIAAVFLVGTQPAQAEETGATYVSEPIEVEGGGVSRTPGQPTSFNLEVTSSELAEADLVAPSLYAYFQSNEFKENIVEGGHATISLMPTAITEENLPQLFQPIDELTNSIEAIVGDVTNLVNRLTNIAPGILTIQGLEEVEQALDGLDNLEASLVNLPAYTNTEIPVSAVDEEGILTVEFGQNFGNHLDKAVYSEVNGHLGNLSSALENLDLVLFEDAITDGNVTIIANGLEGFLNNIPFLGSILDDSFLGNLIGRLGGIIDGLLSWMLPTDAVEELIEVLNELIHEITRSIGDLTEDIPVVAETISNEILNFSDSATALDFMNHAELHIDQVQINEEVSDTVEVRSLITDNQVVDAGLFTQAAAVTQLDFGAYVPLYSPLLTALIVLLLLIVGALIFYIVRLRKNEKTT